jgi:hypothetical protein
MHVSRHLLKSASEGSRGIEVAMRKRLRKRLAIRLNSKNSSTLSAHRLCVEPQACAHVKDFLACQVDVESPQIGNDFRSDPLLGGYDAGLNPGRFPGSTTISR